MRYDQRNMSRNNSESTAQISNISERDGAKYVEKFDDILRAFHSSTKQRNSRTGKIRHEEKCSLSRS